MVKRRKTRGVPSLSVDDAASTAEAAIAPGMFTNQGCGFGNWAECDGGTPTATAAPRLPCDDVKPSASTASRGGSGIVPSAAPVCGKSGKTGDVGELPGQDTKGGGLLQKTQG